ncbi:MAG: TolC family protein, partial [Sphingomicrobium sp.]
MGLYLHFLFGIGALAATMPAAGDPPLQASNGLESAGQPSTEPYDLGIDDAVALAQRRNFRTARAKRSLSVNTLRYDNARSQYRPSLTTSAGIKQEAHDYAWQGNTFAYQVSSLGQFQGTATANLSMPIDVGGVIHRQVAQADLWRQIASSDVTNTALDVTLDVQTSYLNALRAQNNADADEGVAKEIVDLLSRAGPKSTLANFLEVELANARQTAQSSRE